MNKLSVIIPVYNVEKYLDECILSITKELLPQDEIILINDGSKDSSLDICRKYESDNIHVINNTNHGVSYSRNCGIERASGDYVTFVDSDDYLLSGWRETLEKGMESGKDIVYFTDTDAPLPDVKSIISNILCFPTKEKLYIKASACWYKLFRTEFVKDNGITFDCDVINGEDGLFNLRAVLLCRSYAQIKAPAFYFYRVNNASATHSFNEKFNSSNRKFINVVNESLSASNLFTEREVKSYVDFIDSHGLYILACRISVIEDAEERRKKYELFEQPEYIKLYKEYVPDCYCGKQTKIVFGLLKKGKYDAAMRRISLRRKIFNIARKVLRKRNGF